MLDVDELLQQKQQDLAFPADRNAWRPTLLRLPDDLPEWKRLAELPDTHIHDCITDQLTQLLRLRSPNRTLSDVEMDAGVSAHVGEQPLWTYGVWAHFAWCSRLVHLLPKAEFWEVRADRNRYKILPAEQRRLRQSTVGIVGLSVGQAIAVTMAMEGVGGRFRLADFDQLDLSNMNRLTASVWDLGINKARLAARQMFQLDPFLDIEIFEEGIDDKNLDAFFSDGCQIDLLVEECDDPYVKLRLRERTRELGIPVLMETSDRGMLDIERFDREPARPLIHGRINIDSGHEFSNLSEDAKLATILEIVDAFHGSASACASLFELDETISTWPQLASGVTLGAALVTDSARRILLDQLQASGRFYVDLDQLIRSGSEVEQVAAADFMDMSPDAARPRIPPAQPAAGTGQPTRVEIEFLVANAILAPSGGNLQPWRFHWDGETLEISVDSGRTSMLDYKGRASMLAVGAAVENIALSASVLGLRTSHLEVDDADATCDICFERTAAAVPELFGHIHSRCTNRRQGPRVPLNAEQRERLSAAAVGARFRLIENVQELEVIGEIVGQGELFRFMHDQLHRDLMNEIRWSRQEVEASRDGIDVASLELSPAEAKILHLLSRPSVSQRLRRIGGGRKIVRQAMDAMARASAVGLVGFRNGHTTDYMRIGRAVQRIWLTATAVGLEVQPMTALPFLLMRLASEETAYAPNERATLLRIRDRFRSVLAQESVEEMFLFRLSVSDGPTALSLRRPVAEVLTFA